MTRTFLVLLWVCLLGGCTRNEPIRLGFVGGLTGAVADLGVGGRNGVMLAVEERNAAGGVGGHTVELIVRDDAQNTEAGRQAVADLVAQGVEVIIGPMTSSIAMEVTPQVNKSRTILLSPTVTTRQLSAKDDNFLRVIADTHAYATMSARYQRQNRGVRTVAAIFDSNNKAYSESWLGDFAAELEKLGGTMVLTRSFRSGVTTGFRELAREAVAARPDAVLLVSNAVDAARLCQQVKLLNPRQQIVASEWASTERFTELAGRASEGAVIAQFIDRNDTSPRFLHFTKAYRARFGQEPGFAGLAGYDAAQVAMEAFTLRKPGQSVKETILSRSTFQGVQHPLRIDRFGDADRPSHVAIVQNGTYRTVE